MLCVDISTAHPRATIDANNCMIPSAAAGSRLPVGSSARITCGLFSRARAIANRCCDYHRHRRNATLPTERAAALADDSGDQELREEYERIAGLLATLPEEQAEVIRLKTSDSLTFARIAELTGSTEATVKSRFRYGIGKLRKLINH